jgi:hypothetical protein
MKYIVYRPLQLSATNFPIRHTKSSRNPTGITRTSVNGSLNELDRNKLTYVDK